MILSRLINLEISMLNTPEGSFKTVIEYAERNLNVSSIQHHTQRKSTCISVIKSRYSNVMNARSHILS